MSGLRALLETLNGGFARFEIWASGIALTHRPRHRRERPAGDVWPEAPLALKQGLVRAIELPADFVRPHKFYENAGYLAKTRHRYQMLYPTISEQTWHSLTAEEQRALLEASKEAGLRYTDAVQHAWEDDQEFLKSQGVVIVDFDVTPWHEAAVEKDRQLEEQGTWAEGLVDKVMALNE